MGSRNVRRLLIAGLTGTVIAATALGVFMALPRFAHASPQKAQDTYYEGICIGHKPLPFVHYYSNCTGHDEPEIDPLSSAPGSAQNLTWTIILPTNGAEQVDNVGPTFWTGGTVSDPSSLLGQAFLELQFYPNSLVSKCTKGGGYHVTQALNTYTACSPVWKVDPSTNNELAAFNAMLTDSAVTGPLVMHAGDTITVHQYTTAAKDGMHITVSDLATGHSGTIILNSATDGPLMPAFDKQEVGKSLGWGLVHDAPNSFVWEIGHTGNFTTHPGQFCLPASATHPPCDSYNASSWANFSPVQIKRVTFQNAGHATRWAVVSDFGGKAEVNQYCGAANYGQPYCIYPWYAFNKTLDAFTYGVDYPGTKLDFNQAGQFRQKTTCGGPFGANSTYCVTPLSLDLP